ncbi:MAG: LemA family protein [Candidatus Aphodocola sp.]
MTIAIIIAVIVVLILLYFVSTYNSLVGLRNKVKDQWSQIDVVLKNRNDLIPNIVETVKGYAKHEKETLNEVIEARSKMASANTPEEEMKASGEVTKALGKLFALAESYPELKANENFMDLQNKLNEVEEKIRYARQFYNDSVLTYKNKLEMFPSNIVANMFGFKPEAFFEATEEERKNVQVKF